MPFRRDALDPAARQRSQRRRRSTAAAAAPAAAAAAAAGLSVEISPHALAVRFEDVPARAPSEAAAATNGGPSATAPAAPAAPAAAASGAVESARALRLAACPAAR